MVAGGERMEAGAPYIPAPLGWAGSASNGSFAGLAWGAGCGPCLGRRAAHRAGFFGPCLDVSMGRD